MQYLDLVLSEECLNAFIMSVGMYTGFQNVSCCSNKNIPFCYLVNANCFLNFRKGKIVNNFKENLQCNFHKAWQIYCIPISKHAPSVALHRG